MKVKIVETELYPYFEINTEHAKATGKTINISEEVYEQYKKKFKKI